MYSGTQVEKVVSEGELRVYSDIFGLENRQSFDIPGSPYLSTTFQVISHVWNTFSFSQAISGFLDSADMCIFRGSGTSPAVAKGPNHLINHQYMLLICRDLWAHDGILRAKLLNIVLVSLASVQKISNMRNAAHRTGFTVFRLLPTFHDIMISVPSHHQQHPNDTAKAHKRSMFQGFSVQSSSQR